MTIMEQPRRHENEESFTKDWKESLRSKGYCVVQRTESDTCDDDVELLWDFIEDTSNGSIQRLDSSTWINTKSSLGSFTSSVENTTANSTQESTNSTDAYWPQDGMFTRYGAGWLLGHIRNDLAQKIYEPIFNGTRELHTSIEGFQLLRPLFSAEPSSEISADSSAVVARPVIHSSNYNDGLKSTTSLVRSLTVIHDGSSNDGSTKEMEESCSQSDHAGISVFIRSVSNSDEKSIPTPESITLRSGDVLLYDPDICTTIELVINDTGAYELAISHRNCVALFHCTMEPCRHQDSLMQPQAVDSDREDSAKRISETGCTTTTINVDKENSHKSNEGGLNIAHDNVENGHHKNSKKKMNPNEAYRQWRQRRVDIYKQRETESSSDPISFGQFLQRHMDGDSKCSRLSSCSGYNGRCYFRTSPPLVTRRLAELYGLIPYKANNQYCSNGGQGEGWDDDKVVQRAIIQGVRFVDDICDTVERRPVIRSCPATLQYISLLPSTSSVATESVSTKVKKRSHQKPKQDEQSNLLMGQDKYLGGMASPCGQYIYGVPGTARRVVRIPTSAHHDTNGTTNVPTMDFIGPDFVGKFKWLRGVEIPPSSIPPEYQDVYPKGCCIALPCNDMSFLKVNPAVTTPTGGTRADPNAHMLDETKEAYSFGQDSLRDTCQDIDGWYYHGGNLAENGWIYCIPANAPRVCKVHPATDEVVMIGPTDLNRPTTAADNLDSDDSKMEEEIPRCKWFGGIIGTDGCIYGIPHNTQGVLKIDPTTDEVTIMKQDGGKPLPKGNWKWHGGLAAPVYHKIIGFPNNSDYVLVIDCKSQRVYTVGMGHGNDYGGGENNNEGGGGHLTSGRHRIPQDGRYKYLGGALAKNGRYAYLFPCDAERVLKFDCETDQMTLIGPPLLDGENKFQNGFCSPVDGCLYGIPQRAMGVLRIQPAAFLGEEDHVDIMPFDEEMVRIKDKFEGGVMGMDGSIYCMPLRARRCVRIIPSNPPPAP